MVTGMEKMKVLITGGSGYFGSLLRDRLRARGQPVRIFDLADADDRADDVDVHSGRYSQRRRGPQGLHWLR